MTGSASELLLAKLARPQPPAPVIARPALLAQITAGIARKLTLLAAPAGIGKTTLLAEWATAQPFPVAWLTCDADDNDPVRFWAYLFGAARSWGIGTITLDSPDAALKQFANRLAQLPGLRAIVLDDAHTLSDPVLLAQLARWIEHLPRGCHLLLAARTPPVLPLARWRARNELNELGAGDLRFAAAETRAFLAAALPAPLAPAAIDRLDQDIAGWAAGLRLATLAARGDTAERTLETFSGAHPYVVAYFADEVLAAQPTPVQEFLLATSPASQLNGALADALTGHSDGSETLARLAAENLFLEPSGSGWYRFHPLFAEAMRAQARTRLGETAYRTLAATASAWYAARGLSEPAASAALQAEQWEQAAALLADLAERDSLGNVQRLRDLIERLPEPVRAAQPHIALGYASALLFTGDRYNPGTAHAVETWVQCAEAVWLAEENEPMLGRVAALRAMVAFWQDDMAALFALAHQARALLDPYDTAYQGICRLFIAVEALLNGAITDAQSMALEARTLCIISRNQQGVLAAAFVLASAAFSQGNLELAAGLYEEWYASAAGGPEMYEDQSEALFGLAAVAYERGELDAAEEYARRAQALAHERHAERLRTQAGVMLARIAQARGQSGTAQQQLQALATQAHTPTIRREIRSWQAWQAVASGELDAAERFCAELAKSPAPAARLQQEHEALIAARLQLARGNAAGAFAALEPWRAEAVLHGRTRSEIAILLIQALAAAALPDPARPAGALGRALALAQPRELRRTLLDMGTPLADLLRAQLPALKRANAAYAAILLAAFEPTGLTARGPLLEPLSPQEQRVMRLLVAGRSNAEIAGELIVSPNTVKTHVKNIYRKLAVATRDELRAAVRELNLLRQ